MSDKKIPHINENDYLSISEISKIVDISVKTLQYYDERGIFKPAKRSLKNYRQYHPMQITTVKMARLLRDVGLHLDDIAAYEVEREPGTIADTLLKNLDSIDYQIQSLKDIRAATKSYYMMITEGMNANIDKITYRKLPELPITLGEPTVFAQGKSFFDDFIMFCKKPRVPELNLNYAIGGYFDSMDSFRNHPSMPDRFFSLDPDGGAVREKGTFLVGYTRGYYGTTNDLPERIAEFAKENGFTFSGPVYNIFIQDELCIKDPNEYLLKIEASVKETETKSRRNLKKRPVKAQDKDSK